jgi:hypothetical protein
MAAPAVEDALHELDKATLALAISNAIAAERERCAKICDMRAAIFKLTSNTCSLPLEEECEDIAAAIRRG